MILGYSHSNAQKDSNRAAVTCKHVTDENIAEAWPQQYGFPKD